MNTCCFLLTRFSKILYDKTVGRVFALKYVAEFSKHLPAELFKY